MLVADDLSTGVAARIRGVPLLQIDLTSRRAVGELKRWMTEHAVTSVIHMAARKRVDESIAEPLAYYRDNLLSLANTLRAATLASVERIVFSSSAAVYGSPNGVVDEDAPCEPGNPYGRTKLAGEWMVADDARAQGRRAVSLRYFNVAGAQWPELADTTRANVVPIVLDRVRRGLAPEIYGSDYDTPDGTCVRDYVHVGDIAEAHVAVLDALDTQTLPHRVFNVGTGVGTSVRELVDGVRRRVAASPEPVYRPRRPGDASRVVAAVGQIESEIGWRASRTLDDILDSACEASGTP